MLHAFINPLGTLWTPDGDPPRHADGLGALLAGAELIPVTALDESELLSVPAAFTSWQVLLRGAVILTPDGTEDPAWRRLTLETQRLREQALTLAAQAAGHLSGFGHLGLDVALTGRGGLPLALTLTHPHGLELSLAEAARGLREWLEDSPFRADLRVQHAGGRVTVQPREITPESAVNYLLGELPEDAFTLGVSAQEEDAAFLALCDYALMPGESSWLRRPDAESGEDEAF